MAGGRRIPVIHPGCKIFVLNIASFQFHIFFLRFAGPPLGISQEGWQSISLKPLLYLKNVKTTKFNLALLKKIILFEKLKRLLVSFFNEISCFLSFLMKIQLSG